MTDVREWERIRQRWVDEHVRDIERCLLLRVRMEQGHIPLDRAKIILPESWKPKNDYGFVIRTGVGVMILGMPVIWADVIEPHIAISAAG